MLSVGAEGGRAQLFEVPKGLNVVGAGVVWVLAALVVLLA